MIGGKNPAKNKAIDTSIDDSSNNTHERLFSFEFPEHPGALEKFLDAMGEIFNITLFHYRNHGAAFGQVLAGFEVGAEKETEFFEHLNALGYQFEEVTNNLAYQTFLN